MSWARKIKKQVGEDWWFILNSVNSLEKYKEVYVTIMEEVGGKEVMEVFTTDLYSQLHQQGNHHLISEIACFLSKDKSTRACLYLCLLLAIIVGVHATILL